MKEKIEIIGMRVGKYLKTKEVAKSQDRLWIEVDLRAKPSAGQMGGRELLCCSKFWRPEPRGAGRIALVATKPGDRRKVQLQLKGDGLGVIEVIVGDHRKHAAVFDALDGYEYSTADTKAVFWPHEATIWLYSPEFSDRKPDNKVNPH